MKRSDRHLFSDWLWTVDRISAATVLTLIAIGLLLAVAASPAASGGPSGVGNFSFAYKQIVFAIIAVTILFWASLLSNEQVRLVAAGVFAAALLGSALVLVFGDKTLGAKRWLDFGVFTLQPSEFLKPSFAVLAAAILADERPSTWPKPARAGLLLAPALVILLLQPDVGQTFLLLLLLGAMLFYAGLAFKWIWMMSGATAGLAVLAYFSFSHVHHRVDQFLHPTEKGYQVGLSLKAFIHGGLTGVGPGAGTVKYRLPDVHSDFIFAVAGEEFGLVLCGIIVALFALLCLRLIYRAQQARTGFLQLAGAGLATVVALQVFINIGVSMGIVPAKGMTLPFISAGGSSLFAMALTMGFALALSRSRPQVELGEGPLIPVYGGRP